MKNVDTDMIIPAKFLTSIERQGFGDKLFKVLKEEDPNFPFNLPEGKSRSILVTEENFGCGSSREHAVWALLDHGIKVIVAPSFSDIFSSNAAKNGLLLIKVPREVLQTWKNLCPIADWELTSDLAAKILSTNFSRSYHFSIDDFTRHCFLQGLDTFDYLYSQLQGIKDFKARQNIFLDNQGTL